MPQFVKAWLAIHRVGESGQDSRPIAENNLGTVTRPAIAESVTRCKAGQSFPDRLKDAFGGPGDRFQLDDRRTVKADTAYRNVVTRRIEPPRSKKDQQSHRPAPTVAAVEGAHCLAPRVFVGSCLPVPSTGKPHQKPGESDQ